MASDSDEALGIDAERQRYILEVFGRLATATHYEMLGVRLDADKATVKRAYFEHVRTMHPDRYFGKNLGTYRTKLDAIFARMTEAYETLANPARRAAYDQAHAAELQSTAKSPSNRPLDPAVAASRQAAMDALKKRFAEGKAKANEHAAAAVRARAAGDLVAAGEAYKRALEAAPGDANLQTAYDEVQREAAARLVVSHRKKAELEERWGRWAEAAASWRHVVAGSPDDVEARTRLANALARAGKKA